MGCERIDYCTDEEYQQALQYEQQQRYESREDEDGMDEYWEQMAEFEDWIKHKHNGCWYSAAKELNLSLDQNEMFNRWLNPPKKQVPSLVTGREDLPF